MCTSCGVAPCCWPSETAAHTSRTQTAPPHVSPCVDVGSATRLTSCHKQGACGNHVSRVGQSQDRAPSRHDYATWKPKQTVSRNGDSPLDCVLCDYVQTTAQRVVQRASGICSGRGRVRPHPRHTMSPGPQTAEHVLPTTSNGNVSNCTPS